MPGEELLLRMTYAGERFDAPTIRRMLGHLQTILEVMVADSNQRLADIPLLAAEERGQLFPSDEALAGQIDAACFPQLVHTCGSGF